MRLTSALIWVQLFGLAAGVACANASTGEEAPLREAFPADDFTLTEAMVPMRDGVKLYTLIATPQLEE